MEGWSAEEECDLLLKQLPHEWRLKIVQEENKRRRTQYWVSFLGGHLSTPSVFRANLRAHLGIEVGELLPVTGGFHVPCKNESERQELLNMHESELEGELIYVSKIDKIMRGEDIIHWWVKV